MRAAPPCTVTLADPRAERGLVVLLHGLAAAAAGGWVLALAGTGAVWSALLLGVAALAGLGWGATIGMAPLRHGAGAAAALHWSGQAWHLLPSAAGAATPATALAGLDLAIDAGPWLLLRARRAGMADAWLVVRPALAGASAWPALCVVLAAQAGARSDARPNPGLVG